MRYALSDIHIWTYSGCMLRIRKRSVRPRVSAWCLRRQTRGRPMRVSVRFGVRLSSRMRLRLCGFNAPCGCGSRSAQCCIIEWKCFAYKTFAAFPAS